MTRVLFLTLYPETMPSSRLRVYQYLPALKPFGIEGTVLPALQEPYFSRFYFSRSKWIHALQYGMEVAGTLRRIFESRHYDIVFLQKGIVSTNFRGLDRLFGGLKAPLIFDLDDSIYEKNIVEFSQPFLRNLQDPDQTKKISSRCFAVVAGNHYLKELALRYNRNVFMIPTPVDTNRFRPQSGNFKGDRKEIVIGWMGLEVGLAYLKPLEKVFQELSHRYRIQLRIISRSSRNTFNLNETAVQRIPWSYETEVQEMEKLDIGIMPLLDDEMARGKCGLKLLQYMAMGLPSVSSRIGANCDIVEEGKDGFLATTSDEWLEKLSLLIEDSQKRKSMGEAARKKVLEKYSLEKTTPLLADVLKKAKESF